MCSSRVLHYLSSITSSHHFVFSLMLWSLAFYFLEVIIIKGVCCGCRTRGVKVNMFSHNHRSYNDGRGLESRVQLDTEGFSKASGHADSIFVVQLRHLPI